MTNIIRLPNVFTISEFQKLKNKNFYVKGDQKLNKVIYVSTCNTPLYPETYGKYEKFNNRQQFTNNRDILDDAIEFTPTWMLVTNLHYHEIEVIIPEIDDPIQLDSGFSILSTSNIIRDTNFEYLMKFVY